MTMIQAFLLACKASGACPVQVAEAALRMSVEEVEASAKESSRRVLAELRKLPRKP
mgnify:CR=1 FL=1